MEMEWLMLLNTTSWIRTDDRFPIPILLSSLGTTAKQIIWVGMQIIGLVVEPRPIQMNNVPSLRIGVDSKIMMFT